MKNFHEKRIDDQSGERGPMTELMVMLIMLALAMKSWESWNDGDPPCVSMAGLREGYQAPIAARRGSVVPSLPLALIDRRPGQGVVG